MGEELQNQTEEQVQEEPVQETPEPKAEEKIEEISPVKILRKKYEDILRENKQLKEEIKKLKEVVSISDVNTLISKLNKLELENVIHKQYPELAGEIDKILEMRKPDEPIEDTIARYIGKKALESQKTEGIRSSNLGAIPSEPDIINLPKEERDKIAEELFKKVYGIK